MTIPKLSSAAILTTVFAVTVLATSAVPSLAGPCTMNLLSIYLSGGANATCTVLDKTISGMTTSGGILSGTFVTPLTEANNPGLDFHGASIIPRTIMFTITAPSSDPITDASLAILGAGTTTSFQVTATLTNGKSLSASDSSLAASIAFEPATSLTVTNTLSGAVFAIRNQFSETPVTEAPEPASLALLGVALSALGLVRLQKRFKGD